MKTVGDRRVDGSALDDQGRLARTAVALRRGRGFAPRGVYRFTTFEEAAAWMTRMMLSSREPRNPGTSPASAEP